MWNFPGHFIKLHILILVLCGKAVLLEPISLALGVSSGIIAAGAGFYKYGYCKLYECCDEDYIPADFNALKYELESKFYGQNIAIQVVLSALMAHWEDKEPQKALTLSLHGLPGCGKNYITRFIKQALYKKGSDSKFIHHFMGRMHFPLEEKVEEYKQNLYRWIEGNNTKCERSLYIFDEVDKMPPAVLNAIKPMIDYNERVNKNDYRKSVFIFLSNTGGHIIKDHMLTLWRQGRKRDSIALHDFENLISKGVFNEKGGFFHSDTIKSNLIDHYIPFLPMEREHVELCIKDQFARRKIFDPHEMFINEVLNFINWGPPPENLYSTTGCKRISQKVALVIQQFKLRN